MAASRRFERRRTGALHWPLSSIEAFKSFNMHKHRAQGLFEKTSVGLPKRLWSLCMPGMYELSARYNSRAFGCSFTILTLPLNISTRRRLIARSFWKFGSRRSFAFYRADSASQRYCRLSPFAHPTANKRTMNIVLGGEEGECKWICGTAFTAVLLQKRLVIRS